MWPQYVMLVLALLTIYSVSKDAVNAPRSESHTYVVVKLLASYFYVCLVALVLHCGGF